MRGLRKAFGGKQVLDGVDLDVAPGTSTVVIGGSGTGKSVLIKSHPGPGGARQRQHRDRRPGHPRHGAARAGGAARAHRHAVPERRAVRQPAGLGERGLRAARPGQGDPGRGARAGGGDAGAGRAGPSVGALSPAELSGRHAEARGPGARHRGAARHPVLRRADHGARPDHGRGDRRADRGLRASAWAPRPSPSPTTWPRPRASATARRCCTGGGSCGRGRRRSCMHSGNAVVEQFTHGRREGPIQMELRR